MSNLKVYFFAFAFFGIFGILMIFYTYSDYSNFFKLKYGDTELVDGLITDKYLNETEFGTVPIYVVQFIELSGNKYFTQSVYSPTNYNIYEVGQEVEIIYFKPDPTLARINSKDELVKPIIGSLLFNSSFVLLGCVAILIYKLKKDDIFPR